MIYTSNPKIQYKSIQKKIDKAINTVLNSDNYILGKYVKDFEESFAKYIQTKYAIGVANGTDAIELVLRALEIGAGDEVITTSHTALASVAAIQCAGASPILCDIGDETFNIDPDKVLKLITKKTRAILAVHLYGTSCNLELLKKICKNNNIYLIEDVSQAHGAYFKKKRLGSIGIAGCFSCYPTKNLGAIGDAGVITTNNKSLAIKLKKIRQYGWKEPNMSYDYGRNSRLDELQAAILTEKLKCLDSNNNKRKKIANYYDKHLTNKVIKPVPNIYSDHVYHLYVIKTTFAKNLKIFLKKNNILCGVHYPLPVHLQPAYKGKIGESKHLKNTEALIGNILSIPLYPELSANEYKFICSTINSFFK